MEAALVIPVLLMVVFAIVDFGRMLNAQITVTEAAREGARALSLGASADARVSAVLGGGTYTVDDSDGCTTRSPTDDATVVVTYQFQFITPVSLLAGFAGGPINLDATGVMPCQG